jgi:choline-glycine betaine transporter
MLILFVIASLINIEVVSGWVNASFAWSCKYFGAYWQVLLFATFVIAVILAFSKYGGLKLGNLEAPEMSTFRWISIIMCTLLAGGGVFWSAAEPTAGIFRRRIRDQGGHRPCIRTKLFALGLPRMVDFGDPQRHRAHVCPLSQGNGVKAPSPALPRFW